MPYSKKSKQLSLDWIYKIVSIRGLKMPIGALFCAALAISLYLTAIGHGFVLDDNLVITSNTHIQEGMGGIPDLLKYNYAHGHDGYNDGLYRPLSLVSFAIGQAMHELNPSIMHITQALFYGLLVLMLYLWLSQLFVDHKAAVFWIVVLFTVHPIHTEVVANIKSRDELFALLFFAIAAWQFTLWLNSRKVTSLIWAMLFMLLASFSKESAVTFIAIIPLIAIYLKSNRKTVALGSLAMSAPVALFLIIRSLVLSNLGEVDSGVANLLQNSLIEMGGIAERIVTSATIQGLYIEKLFFPVKFSHDYSFNAIPVVGFSSLIGLLWLIINVGFIGLGVWGAMQQKLWAFGILFYYITISVVSNLFILIGAMAAERFVFTPSLGWVFAIVFALFGVERIKKFRTPALAVITLVFTGLTLFRIPDWKSNLELFTTDVEVSDNSARAHYNAGTALNDHAKAKPREAKESFAKAEYHLTRAIEIWPEYQDAYNNLGITYMNSGAIEKAYETYSTLIKRFPTYNKARYNMGMTCYNLKKYPEAEKHLEVYLSAYPTNVNALLYAAEAEGYQSKFGEAREHLLSLVAIDPNSVNGYMKLGIASGMLQDNENALKHLKKAEQLAPKNADVKINLAVYYLSNGVPNEAKAYLEQCLQYHPGHPRATQLLASINAQ